jgi:hypothetical protein
MKRARELKPPKKQNMEQFVINYKVVFQLVLPYVFPGFYADDWKTAFKTYLALMGTCKGLRYWNFLRRWVGWLSDQGVRPLLKSNSVPVPLSMVEMVDYQCLIGRIVEKHSAWRGIASPCVTSRRLLNHFREGYGDTNFEFSLAGIPFWNLFDIDTEHRDVKTLCFVAPTFAEMALFCYAAVREPRSRYSSYLVVPGWVHREKDFFYFEDATKDRFMQKFMLGRLKAIGQVAPPDSGFALKALPNTAYSEFCSICDTSGKRSSSSPLVRLERFVQKWYPLSLWPRTETEKRQDALRFEIKFL